MADTDLQTRIGGMNVVDKRNNPRVSTSPISSTTFSATRDVAAAKAALTAANATYYTAARLRDLSFNDMVFALREINDLAGMR